METECVTNSQVQYGPETNEQRYDRLREKLKTTFSALGKVKKEHELYEDNCLNKERVIVDIDLLLPLFNDRCQYKSCSGTSKVTNVKIETGCCHISWECSNEHLGSWSHLPCCATRWTRYLYK